MTLALTFPASASLIACKIRAAAALPAAFIVSNEIFIRSILAFSASNATLRASLAAALSVASFAALSAAVLRSATFAPFLAISAASCLAASSDFFFAASASFEAFS